MSCRILERESETCRICSRYHCHVIRSWRHRGLRLQANIRRRLRRNLCIWFVKSTIHNTPSGKFLSSYRFNFDFHQICKTFRYGELDIAQDILEAESHIISIRTSHSSIQIICKASIYSLLNSWNDYICIREIIPMDDLRSRIQSIILICFRSHSDEIGHRSGTCRRTCERILHTSYRYLISRKPIYFTTVHKSSLCIIIGFPTLKRCAEDKFLQLQILVLHHFLHRFRYFRHTGNCRGRSESQGHQINNPLHSIHQSKRLLHSSSSSKGSLELPPDGFGFTDIVLIMTLLPLDTRTTTLL